MAAKDAKEVKQLLQDKNSGKSTQLSVENSNFVAAAFAECGMLWTP